MSDRELLEAAATAAGYVLQRHTQKDLAFTVAGVEWNPLADDGDALRLATRTNLEICVASPITYARAAMQEGLSAPISEFHQGDAPAATRRAIVRAAAALAVDPNGRPNL
jgi:hypothetical protein